MRFYAILKSIAETSSTNDLYLVVLPIISLSTECGFGRTEQVLTLLPDRKLASEFFRDQVESFVRLFKNRTSYFVGGHVTGYEFEYEEVDADRVVVKVIQRVSA